jgi:hypothetical protein
MDDERPMNLPLIDCCATCTHFRGWLDNARCGKYQIAIFPYTKCDTFERRPDLPVWVLVEPIKDEATS